MDKIVELACHDAHVYKQAGIVGFCYTNCIYYPKLSVLDSFP